MFLWFNLIVYKSYLVVKVFKNWFCYIKNDKLERSKFIFVLPSNLQYETFKVVQFCRMKFQLRFYSISGINRFLIYKLYIYQFPLFTFFFMMPFVYYNFECYFLVTIILTFLVIFYRLLHLRLIRLDFCNYWYCILC